MKQPTILVAGIGNIFLGDDAFGCEVVKRLSGRKWPENVKVVDYGIRGFDLAYALLDGFDVTIFVDATPRGQEPGTLYTIEPEVDEVENIDGQGAMVETHGMDPMKVLNLVKSMGGQFRKILLVGCEPATFGPEEGQLGLSEPVEAAVAEAVRIVESLVAKELLGAAAQVVYE
ncbi:MAG TPA: hydrogenase maturation protease [Pyrinomonadaceae bacterium]|jgi:hydrogenase maturation protease|nr:hydrogenase maturation protease [Pyrinomonadaceae bacterium]